MINLHSKIKKISHFRMLYLKTLLLLNLIPLTHENHIVTPTLTDLLDRRNIFQCQNHRLEVLEYVLPAAVWFAVRSQSADGVSNW